MSKFIRFEMKFSEAVVAFLGLFLGAKNLLRSVRESRRRGLFSGFFAAFYRAIGLLCAAVGAFYLLTGIKVDLFSRKRDEEEDEIDDDDEYEIDDDEDNDEGEEKEEEKK